jgi:hypothetical protein
VKLLYYCCSSMRVNISCSVNADLLQLYYSGLSYLDFIPGLP